MNNHLKRGSFIVIVYGEFVTSGFLLEENGYSPNLQKYFNLALSIITLQT